MDCAQVEELLGAHALDTLTEAAARQVETHLAGCAEHRRAVQELRRTASLLALTVEERQPSPELRSRTLEAIAAGSGPPRSIPTPAPRPIWRLVRLPRWRPRPAFAAVMAAVLLVFAGIGAVIQHRLDQINAAEQSWTFRGTLLAPNATAQLVYLRRSKEALVSVDGLRPLTGGEVYEMWLIKGNTPVAEGIGTATEGRLTAHLSGDLSQFDAFAITIEPHEVKVPTTNPILLGMLRSGSR